MLKRRKERIWVDICAPTSRRQKSYPAFPDAKPAKPKTLINRNGDKKRKRWKSPDGTIYEWDYQHGTLEKYDKNGKHQGEFRPDGTTIGPSRNRKINP